MNYSGRQGVSVNQTSACVETLNLPGGQQQGRVLGDRDSRNSEFVSRLSLKPQSTMETEGLGGGGRRSWEHLGTGVGICEYADTVCPLLEMDGWPPPGRSVSPHLGGGGGDSGRPVSTSCDLGLSYSLAKPSFLSFSLQPHTVAASAFQPSSPSPTSWLTLLL